MTKKCSLCLIEKDLTNFYPDKRVRAEPYGRYEVLVLEESTTIGGFFRSLWKT